LNNAAESVYYMVIAWWRSRRHPGNYLWTTNVRI